MKTRTRGAPAPLGDGGSAATLGMVARAAGVSASTVSRILNGSAGVSNDKQAAVMQAIERLGFVPNPVARGLAGGRTLSIGVLTQSIDSPFYGGTLRGIEDVLDRAGYSPLFVSGHWNAAEEARCIALLRARRVDGIIVLTGRLADEALVACARTLPVVVTGRRLQAPALLALEFDHEQGARLATQHLLGLGHRRIAFIGGDPGHPDAHQRLLGYRAALRAAGVPIERGLIAAGLFTEDSGCLAVEHLLERRQRFSAVFAANDQMAFGACLGLYRRGLRVPHDVSVVGFDDLPAARYTVPPLTTVRHPACELGRLAATAMLQLLRGEAPEVAVPAPQMVLRESCAAPAQP